MSQEKEMSAEEFKSLKMNSGFVEKTTHLHTCECENHQCFVRITSDHRSGIYTAYMGFVYLNNEIIVNPDQPIHGQVMSDEARERAARAWIADLKPAVDRFIESIRCWNECPQIPSH